jgi:asparagine synthase (glutamine-hydrolysing)
MCGIAGIAGDVVSADTAAAAGLVRGMIDTLAHRGPDGEGVVVEAPAALGHRRLSIIDISGGAQPMCGASGAVLVLNGEIYNYVELREAMRQQGEHFTTSSDTEVLLRLFEREGPACLDRLVGMFAFAVWEPARRRLFLARDRLGKKPLFVARGPWGVAFASEIKALLALPQVAAAAQPDLRALSDVLSLGYVLTPKTMFANIERFPAGHAAEYHPDNRSWRCWDYWGFEEHVTAEREPVNARTDAAFEELVHDAVRIRLRADVPVGLFLSGGLDSSAIAASLRQIGADSVHAYCVGFPSDSGYDESPHAQRVAEHLGLPFEVLPFAAPDSGKLEQLIWHFDEPFADTSAMPTFLLNREARSKVKVALSGDGGDEILAGYVTYRADALYRHARRLPAWLPRMAAGALKRMRPSYRKVSWDYKLRQFLSGHGLPPERAHLWWRQLFSHDDKRLLLTADALASLDGYDPMDEMAAWYTKVRGAPFLDQSMYVDLKTWLQDDILVKADRMSMAHGIELRSPLLDHRLVEFATKLPVGAKMNALRHKVILRRMLAGKIPDSVLRRPKSGFSAPTASCGALRVTGGGDWFRKDFALDARAENVTYKSFVLAAVNTWMDIFDRFRQTNRWPGRAVEDTK